MFEKLRDELNNRDAFAKFLGIRVEEIAPGYSRARMDYSPQLTNSFANLHGGASFSLADMAFAAVAISSGVASVNISSSITFINSGKEGPFIAEGRLISQSRKLCTIEVTITDAQDTVIAKMLGTGYKMGKAFA